MTTLEEGDLAISFPRGTDARKFDDATHGLSHCMKAVDFIIELTEPDRIFFIEIKDPDNPQVPPKSRKEFAKNFLAEKLDADLTQKFRDSFLYEWACGNVSKPVYYWVVIGLCTLTPVELLTRTDALKQKLPVRGPASGKWKRNMVENCAVFTIQTWNRSFPKYPIARMKP